MNIKIRSNGIKTTIQKINGDWTAGYFGLDDINHYLIHAKTKDNLIHELMEMILKK